MYIIRISSQMSSPKTLQICNEKSIDITANFAIIVNINSNTTTEENTMYTAKNKEHYIKAWKSHVMEVGTIIHSLDDDDGVDLMLAMAKLNKLIEKAADKAFEGEE